MSAEMKRYLKKCFFSGLLVFSILLSGNYHGKLAAAEGIEPFTALPSYYAEIRSLEVLDYDDYSLTLSWYSEGNHTGFDVYRKTTFDNEYQKLDTIDNVQNSTLEITDPGFRRGITYTYKVVAFQQEEEETIELESVTSAWKLSILPVEISSAKRSNKTKAKVTWNQSPGVDGYEIYKKTAGSTFKLARRIAGEDSLKCTIQNISQKKNTSYKVRGYVKQNGRYAYGAFSEKLTIEKLDTSKIAAKFRKLQKLYPDGKYWNHAGKTSFSSTTVTSTPCHHSYNGLAGTCNYYHCPNGILGYQCYGFAWKMSDLIYGKSAKIKTFSSFAKSKAGDVIRYSGHSVIIVSKHSNYITVGECNYGDTCMIKWGRKIYKAELAGASYSRRYK